MRSPAWLHTPPEETRTLAVASPGTTSDLWGMQVARATDGDSERLGERTPREGGGRGRKWRRKRNDLCKANVGLSQLWEITGKRLIMPTSTLLFSKKENSLLLPRTPFTNPATLRSYLAPLFYQSWSLASLPHSSPSAIRTHNHTHTHTQSHLRL